MSKLDQMLNHLKQVSDSNDFESYKEQIKLTGKDNISFNNQGGYTEKDINDTDTQTPYGELFSLVESKENELFKKMILFETFETRTNKFDKYSLDVVYHLVDRDGIKILSYSFRKLDTSNQVTYVSQLNELKGNIVWLEGRVVRGRGRLYIEVLSIDKSGYNSDLKLFFKREVANREEIASKVWESVARYPLTASIHKRYRNIIETMPLLGIYEKQGSYLKYFDSLMILVNNMSLETRIKDVLLATDLIIQLKMVVDNIELAKVLQYCLISQYNNVLCKEILDDTLFNANIEGEKSIYIEIIKDLRKGIMSTLLLEEWSNWDAEIAFSPIYHFPVKVGLSYEKN